ncbi:hypothetical protein ACXWRS_12515, partial [Streptococcus pyogenes]
RIIEVTTFCILPSLLPLSFFLSSPLPLFLFPLPLPPPLSPPFFSPLFPLPSLSLLSFLPFPLPLLSFSPPFLFPFL